jgi:hypothetical protein
MARGSAELTVSAKNSQQHIEEVGNNPDVIMYLTEITLLFSGQGGLILVASRVPLQWVLAVGGCDLRGSHNLIKHHSETRLNSQSEHGPDW